MLSGPGACRAELLGYDDGHRGGYTVGTWLVYQRMSSSGIVINGASTNGYAGSGVGGADATRIRRMVLNVIELLLGFGAGLRHLKSIPLADAI